MRYGIISSVLSKLSRIERNQPPPGKKVCVRVDLTMHCQHQVKGSLPILCTASEDWYESCRHGG